jgi:large subunit ribosomal protein L16
VKNQKVMFEIGGVSEEVARESLRPAQHKLPIKTRVITKEVETEIGGE